MLPNTFTWSYSRHVAFRGCERKYWLQYYGAWGGWERGASDEVRRRYVEKKLHTRASLLGTLVHEAAAWALGEVGGRGLPPLERARERYLRDARRRLESSVAGLNRLSPSKHAGLAEDYYGEGLDGEAFLEELADLLGKLYEHPVFLRAVEVPGRVVEIEELHQVQLGGVPVWVSLDVLLRDGRGGMSVVDWKTGRAQDAASVDAQLGVYVAYVLSDHLPGRDASSVTAVHADIRGGGYRVWRGRDDLRSGAVALVRSSSRSMLDRCTSARENTAEERDFEPLDVGSKRCEWCVLRGACGREADKN